VELNNISLDRLGEDERAMSVTGMWALFFRISSCATLTALENVMVPLELRGKRISVPLEDLLDKVGLSDRLHHSCATSGANSKECPWHGRSPMIPFLFADEPTGNLDAETSEKVIRLYSILTGKRDYPDHRNAQYGAGGSYPTHYPAKGGKSLLMKKDKPLRIPGFCSWLADSRRNRSRLFLFILPLFWHCRPVATLSFGYNLRQDIDDRQRP